MTTTKPVQDVIPVHNGDVVIYVNASNLNEQYNPVNPPIVVDL